MALRHVVMFRFAPGTTEEQRARLPGAAALPAAIPEIAAYSVGPMPGWPRATGTSPWWATSPRRRTGSLPRPSGPSGRDRRPRPAARGRARGSPDRPPLTPVAGGPEPPGDPSGQSTRNRLVSSSRRASKSSNSIFPSSKAACRSASWARTVAWSTSGADRSSSGRHPARPALPAASDLACALACLSRSRWSFPKVVRRRDTPAQTTRTFCASSPLRPGADLELDLLARLERAVAGALDVGVVDEDVVPVVTRDEAVALLGVEELDRTDCHGASAYLFWSCRRYDRRRKATPWSVEGRAATIVAPHIAHPRARHDVRRPRQREAWRYRDPMPPEIERDTVALARQHRRSWARPSAPGSSTCRGGASGSWTGPWRGPRSRPSSSASSTCSRPLRRRRRRGPPPRRVLRRRRRAPRRSTWASTSPTACRSATASRPGWPAATSGAWPSSSSSGPTPAEAADGPRTACGGRGARSTVDLLGEKTVVAAEADRYAARCARAARHAERRRDRAGRPTTTSSATTSGPLPRVNVSVKPTALATHYEPLTARRGRRRRPRTGCGRSCADARRRGAFVNVDMEHYDAKDLTLRAVPRAAVRGRVRRPGRRHRRPGLPPRQPRRPGRPHRLVVAAGRCRSPSGW